MSKKSRGQRKAKGHYKGKPQDLLKDLNERLEVACEDGVDPWGQASRLQDIIDDIKFINDRRERLEKQGEENV